jgi:hypothetical protein
MKVLIVDDQPVNGMLAMAMLSRIGCPGLEAASGEEALMLLERDGDISHVLLDICMPGMNGLEVCKRLRSRSDGGSLHIVAYTAHAHSDEKASILAAGFDDLLIKPIRRAELYRSLGIE